MINWTKIKRGQYVSACGKYTIEADGGIYRPKEGNHYLRTTRTLAQAKEAVEHDRTLEAVWTAMDSRTTANA